MAKQWISSGERQRSPRKRTGCHHQRVVVFLSTHQYADIKIVPLNVVIDLYCIFNVNIIVCKNGLKTFAVAVAVVAVVM